MSESRIHTSVNSLKWQGYRPGDKGVIVFYDSDSDSKLPLRKISAKKNKPASMDPNYETSTYGLYDCVNSKQRNTFVKRKYGYIFFMTRYEGTNEDFDGKLMITGYYKINRTTDVQKLHLRQLDGTSCINDRVCQAIRGGDAVFLSEEESYILTAASLKSLGYEKKVTRMTKITLDEEQVQKVLKKFTGKENFIESYIEETLDLLPNFDEDE